MQNTILIMNELQGKNYTIPQYDKLFYIIFFLICSLTVKRWKCGLVGIGGCLYAVGGMDSPKAGHWGLPLKTVERYDPDLDVWTEVASMNEARFGCAVAAYQVSTYLLQTSE